MKVLKPIFVTIISVLLFSLNSCDFHCVDPEGPIITDYRVMETFTGVDIKIPADVKLVVGSKPGISITAPESYIDAISTTIRRGNLHIDGDVCKADNYDIRIEISIPSLEELYVAGSANVYSDTPIKSDKLDLEIDGSGAISMSVFTNDINAKINGSGDIVLNGTCQNIQLGINGSGSFKGLGLNSFKSRIKINGSGNASVVAHNKLHATVNGSGDINYSGDPEINISISGSGKVNKIN